MALNQESSEVPEALGSEVPIPLSSVLTDLELISVLLSPSQVPIKMPGTSPD